MRVSGAGVANYYQASEASELEDVFKALAQTITNNLGYSGVSIDDGIIRRGEHRVPTSLTYEDLTLNLENSVLWCGPRSEQLSPKEFSVMRLLMERPGDTLTMKKLMTTVWDGDTRDNNVEVVFTYLRRKLKKLGSLVGIRKIQGQGYVFSGGQQ